MEPDKNMRLVEEHRKDLLRQAEQYRLAQQALADAPPKDGLRTRLLRFLGQRLANMDCHLKRPFGRQALSSTGTADLNPCED